MTTDIKALSKRQQRKVEPVRHEPAPAPGLTRVRMRVTRAGSVDGIHTTYFQAGQSYLLINALARPWLEKGYAEEDKMLDGAPETK
jgi:hypothetical protein